MALSVIVFASRVSPLIGCSVAAQAAIDLDRDSDRPSVADRLWSNGRMRHRSMALRDGQGRLPADTTAQRLS